jgi:hypothetical protein
MYDNPYDQFDSEAPQAKLPPMSGHGGRWQDAPLAQDPWAGFQAAPAEQSDSGPWDEFKPASGPWDEFKPAPGEIPIITDDGSNWAPAQYRPGGLYLGCGTFRLGPRALGMRLAAGSLSRIQDLTIDSSKVLAASS